MAYAWTELHCPERRGAGLELTADVPCVYIWVNRALCALLPGRDQPEVRPHLLFSQGGLVFRKGWNSVLIKTLSRPGTRFHLRWRHHPRHPEKPFMDDLEYRVPGPTAP